ncbi:Hypothetical protein FKW44_012241 [Caligus rogercresseyi]|uniref:Uncharacterized protein n=1 Tax=Caligus rogercresseyi TaxID=217165 RepID=A0A7T8HJG8_CALRO|nr:Hypothetical protein FKW44_012241 [Caligus rogercresseyi]
MTDKIRRNPTLANDIKAGEVELISELKASISALNVRWAAMCMKCSVLQELKDALQALSIAGKTPSSTAAREINVLNYVSPFSGEEESPEPLLNAGVGTGTYATSPLWQLEQRRLTHTIVS